MSVDKQQEQSLDEGKQSQQRIWKENAKTERFVIRGLFILRIFAAAILVYVGFVLMLRVHFALVLPVVYALGTVVALTNLGSLLIFLYAFDSDKPHIMRSFLIFKGLAVVWSPFYAVLTFRGGFSPGALLTFGSSLIVPIALLVLVGAGVWLHRHINKNARHMVFYWTVGLLIVASYVTPAVGWLGVKNACYRLNQSASRGIIQAVEIYRSEHNGKDPYTLEELVPDYLARVPLPPCTGLSAAKDNYSLEDCGGLVLLNQTVDLMGYERYEFATETWARVWSFLDGICCC